MLSKLRRLPIRLGRGLFIAGFHSDQTIRGRFRSWSNNSFCHQENVGAQLPNFLVIGAAKSGTTSFFDYLGQHPDIFISPVKEPNFFAFSGESSLDYHISDIPWVLGSVRNFEDYRGLFSRANSHNAIGEASGTYLFHPRAAERIHRFIPDAKLIAILRNPVDRAYSAWLMHHRRGKEKRPFKEILAMNEQPTRYYRGSYLEKGLYCQQLMRYFKYFDRDQIRIFLYDQLCDDPHSLVQETYSFLGVDSGFNADLSARHNIAPGGYKMPSQIRAELIERYSEEIESLSGLIGRDLRGWVDV